jgi:hypothetical protein
MRRSLEQALCGRPAVGGSIFPVAEKIVSRTLVQALSGWPSSCRQYFSCSRDK